MKERVLNHLQLRRTKRFTIEEIEKELKEELKGNRGAFFYRDLGLAIMDLEAEGVIKGIKSSKKHPVNKHLFNKYQMTERKELIDKETIATLLSGYNPSINTSFFLQHTSNMDKASFYLKKISMFLDEKKEQTEWMSLNERSYDLFGDEKFLASPEGRILLKNINMTTDDLYCYETFEPFFYYQIPKLPVENILIIENKDTFFSLKRLMQEGVHHWNGKAFSLLVYGEGNKIAKSIEFLDELGMDEQTPIYYFGDLDPEGISIYHRTKKKTVRKIRPFTYFYEALWERKNNSRKWDNHRCSPEAMKEFLSHFKMDWSQNVEAFLDSNGCIPQEGLHLEMLRRLSDGTR